MSVTLGKKLAFAAFSLLLAVAILEVSLHGLAAASSRVDRLLADPGDPFGIPETIPDERLGYRLNPRYPGHDSKGFKNPHVPQAARIVALGDSQTYPTGIAPELAWPRQLESLVRQAVYSMAVPGYGPVQSLTLWDEALALHPAIAVEAFYAGNDLFDAFNNVYNQGQHPELKSPEPQQQQDVREAEEREPISRLSARMYGMGTAESPSGLRVFLSRHSTIYGLLRRTRYELPRLMPADPWKEATVFAAAHPDYCQVFNDERFRTVFTSEYRLNALNLHDARIAEGHQIALRAIGRMHERARENRVRLIVALIPTKELMFKDLWKTPSDSFRLLTDSEIHFWRLTREYFDKNGIEFVDVLPGLRAELAAGRPPYHVSHDGHPNGVGHRAIARVVFDQIEKRHAPSE